MGAVSELLFLLIEVFIERRFIWNKKVKLFKRIIYPEYYTYNFTSYDFLWCSCM